MLDNIRSVYKWKKAQNKVNNAVSVFSKFGFAYSRTEGIIGDVSGLSKRDLKKVHSAADTMGKYQAGYYTDKKTFTSSDIVNSNHYTPLKFSDYETTQLKAYQQANSSMHLRAAIKFNQRINFDPRLQAHPNRRFLNISAEDAQEWAANVESLWRDDKESKQWDETLQNNYYQSADIEFWNYSAIGEFFTIRRPYYNDENRITNISLQSISPFQVKSPYFSGYYPLSLYNYDGNQIVNTSTRQYLNNLKNGNYIESGIEYNKKNQEVAIFLEPSNYGEPWKRIPVENSKGFKQVLHGFIQTEPGQKRGIPESATAWHEFMNITDLCLFELESARLNTVIAGTVTADSNAQPNGKKPMAELGTAPDWNNLEGSGSVLPEYTDPGYSVRQVESGGFIIQNFTPGYKYNELDTKRPNINIPEYIERLLEFIYPSVSGLSVVTVKQRFDRSYNGSKGAIDLSWKNGVEYILKQFAADYHRPNYDAWLNGKIASGEISAPGWDTPRGRAAWGSMSIITPPKPSMNPLQEAKAATEKLKNATSNGEYEAQQLTGTSYEENVERRKSENKKLADANKPLTQEGNQNV